MSKWYPLTVFFFMGVLVLKTEAWWSWEQEGPNDKIAQDVQDNLEQREAWNKHAKVGVREQALKNLAFHKARVLRTSTDPQEQADAHASLERLLVDPTGQDSQKNMAYDHIMSTYMNYGQPSEQYQEYKRKKSVREITADIQRLRQEYHEINEEYYHMHDHQQH